MERDHRVRGGAVTGLALSTAMALGAVLLTSVFPGSAQVESVLFGSLLGVGDADVARAAVVALIGTAGVLALGPRLAAATFDREWAAQAGGAPGRGDVVLLALVALVVVAALPAVGSLLVGGLLVLPAAAARLLTGRVGPMLAVATGLSLVEVAAGLALARLLDVSPGASIAAVGGVGVAIAAGADVLRRRLLVARARPA
jgi:ABC-type Mn2+/Zn2+ transport system permease subunit